MNNLQLQHDEKRKEYLDHKLGHDDFYLWLADSIGVTEKMLPVPVARVRQSNDQHLNDIPLNLWDRRDPLVRHNAFQAGMKSWSLSDSVCVLKAVARRAAKGVA